MATAADPGTDLWSRYLLDVLPDSSCRPRVLRRSPRLRYGIHSVGRRSWRTRVRPSRSCHAGKHGSRMDTADIRHRQFLSLHPHRPGNAAFPELVETTDPGGYQDSKEAHLHSTSSGCNGSSRGEFRALDLSARVQHEAGLHCCIVSLWPPTCVFKC